MNEMQKQILSVYPEAILRDTLSIRKVKEDNSEKENTGHVASKIIVL